MARSRWVAVVVVHARRASLSSRSQTFCNFLFHGVPTPIPVVTNHLECVSVKTSGLLCLFSSRLRDVPSPRTGDVGPLDSSVSRGSKQEFFWETAGGKEVERPHKVGYKVMVTSLEWVLENLQI